MANEEHMQWLRKGVHAWNAWRQENRKIRIDLSGAVIRAALVGEVTTGQRLTFQVANLSGAAHSQEHHSGVSLQAPTVYNPDTSQLTSWLRGIRSLRSGADLSGADLSGANLSDANLTEADLKDTTLIMIDLERTCLMRAHFNGANLSEANLSRADLRGASLIDTNLNSATITDAYLWETQRSDWSIQGIICEAVYWGRVGEERTTYAPGEFERLYADRTKIFLHYEEGISPIEIATLPALIQKLEAIHPDCVLRLQSIEEAPGGTTVTLVVDDGGVRTPAEIEGLKRLLETTGKRLIGLQRKLLEEASARQWAEEEIARRDKLFARLYIEEKERVLLSTSETKPKALTVMFLDLVGFSKLSEEVRRAKVDMLRALGAAILSRLGGMYINTWGDAIVACFDDPNDGLFLACKFIQHLGVEKINVRIGISRGIVTLQFNDLTKRMDIAGESINVGARLEPMAHTGEVLISEELRYHPDVQEKRFIFMQERRPLKKAVGDQQEGDEIECYSVKLAEEPQE